MMEAADTGGCGGYIRWYTDNFSNKWVLRVNEGGGEGKTVVSQLG